MKETKYYCDICKKEVEELNIKTHTYREVGDEENEGVNNKIKIDHDNYNQQDYYYFHHIKIPIIRSGITQYKTLEVCKECRNEICKSINDVVKVYTDEELQ